IGMDLVEIEPSRFRVDFEMAAKLAGGGDDALHVDLIRLPLADQPPGGMTENSDMAISHGADDAIGLRLGRQIEIGVDGRDYDIELCQDCVRQVEASVIEDINPDPLENSDAVEPLIESIDLPGLTRQARGIETARHGDA